MLLQRAQRIAAENEQKWRLAAALEFIELPADAQVTYGYATGVQDGFALVWGEGNYRQSLDLYRGEDRALFDWCRRADMVSPWALQMWEKGEYGRFD